MKTILVTGAAGYIGKNLCYKLIDNGYNVIQIDTKYGSDILNVDLYEYTPDYIIHLAAISGIKDCQDDVDGAIRDNVISLNKISQYSKDLDIPIFFASSQAVKNPLSSMYATTKLIGENTLKQHNRYIIMRFSNVYGGRDYIETKNSVVASFIKKYMNREPLIINGDGNQTRDFIHCDDICNIIMYCIENGNEGITFDVGTGKETSINELASYFNHDSVINDTDSGTKSSVADTTFLDNHGITPKPRLKKYISKYVRQT
jgi:UDP-glucose 4-epimerase